VGLRLATAVVLLFFAMLAVVAATRASLDKYVPRHVTHHRRIIGYGQIRYDGLGPEAWAQRARRNARLVVTFRRQLANRIDRLIFLVSAFQCIHNYEGSWSANTGNGYYGGLQMDLGFQQSYGRQLLAAKGTANHWAPSEQIAVAITAYESGRGFGPWPNTARMCGLR
jgi:transglycosylase-like protein